MQHSAFNCQLHSCYNPGAKEVAIAEIKHDLQNVSERYLSNVLGVNKSKCTVSQMDRGNVVQALDKGHINVFGSFHFVLYMCTSVGLSQVLV